MCVYVCVCNLNNNNTDLALPGSYQIEILNLLEEIPQTLQMVAMAVPTINEVALALSKFPFVTTTNYVGGYSNSAVYTKELRVDINTSISANPWK